MPTNPAPAIDPEVAKKAQQEFAKAQRDARKKYSTIVAAAKVERDLIIARACLQFSETMTPAPADDK